MTNTKQLPRCNALDSYGKRCRKRSGIEVDYHGDAEIYPWSVSNGLPVAWARINLCIEHAMGVGFDFAQAHRKRKSTKTNDQ